MPLQQLFSNLFVILSLTTYGQTIFSNLTLGINLPPIIGKTLDLKVETNPNSHFTNQLAIGYMQDNKLEGSYYKICDFTENWNNSGAFISFGLRYNTRKNLEKSTFFIGIKIIGGYFDQTADTWDRDNIHRTNIRRTGFFGAIGVESGLTLKIKQKFSIDFGLQYSYPFYTDEQVSSFFSVLPGVGAIGNLQGILIPKFILKRKVKQNEK